MMQPLSCSRAALEPDPLLAIPTNLTTLVVHCSDGRFSNQCDRFVHGRLGRALYDRLVVPGGAAWLVHHPGLGCETAAAREALLLLVEMHQLEHIVLIAHAGCAFYLQRLGVALDRCESRQRADLIAVGRWLRDARPQLHVSAYYARRCNRRVEFCPIYGTAARIPTDVRSDGPAPEDARLAAQPRPFLPNPPASARRALLPACPPQ
jgi:hypothetical protein